MMSESTDLPQGYWVVEKSNGDVMLMRRQWTDGPCFSSVEAAADYARWIETGEGSWPEPVQGDP